MDNPCFDWTLFWEDIYMGRDQDFEEFEFSNGFFSWKLQLYFPRWEKAPPITTNKIKKKPQKSIKNFSYKTCHLNWKSCASAQNTCSINLNFFLIFANFGKPFLFYSTRKRSFPCCCQYHVRIPKVFHINRI